MSNRDNDLAELHADMNDSTLSMSERKHAFWAFNQIQRQLKDKKLEGLRERLIKALQVRDHKVIRSLNEQINEHKYRMHYGK